jgi:putative two-component system response regulator
MAERIALTHHERWDGSGYPEGLRGEEIPLGARIVAVADVFDALTHARPYKEAWAVKEAVAEIFHQAGQHFDPNVVSSFSRLEHVTLLSQATDWEPPRERLPIRSQKLVPADA